ncbi:ABC-type branched-chain amino acid transport system, substrate-binding protein [Thermomonospora echinospora]|uniref:ABC-type branched-chain amino acid transport system, substrate-binding protein n=1 Tax=Thermomonospora echinospora TaxID=1992 RepID=A0A1H5X4A7_9ACTN|nr:ABC transporter substrate-binding protein [Thermomonospora echinospora]SEG06230.1 ABC-type branched-chain amino acid transport system, substrate-binding protein [Thermomonospora echinospora]
MPRASRLVSAVAVLALGLSACGGSSGGPATAAPGAPGVTKEPCPEAIDKSKGCIYLGAISDLTSGPFHELGAPLTRAQQAFWRRVNLQGGIGGYEVDLTRHVVDSRYDPATHQRLYRQMKDKVLALAQTLGSPTTARILPELRADKMVAAPASWVSAWEFEDVILESGTNYCFESMNAVDYAVDTWKSKSMLVVHYDNDYGADSLGGARIAAERNEIAFKTVATAPGAERQSAAVAAILADKPDLVLLTVGPADVGAILAQTSRAGYQGRFIGNTPAWSKALLEGEDTERIAAVKKQFVYVSPWKAFATDSPGHTAMRRALGAVRPNDNYTSGWVWSYPLKAVIQRAAANGDLTRDGMLKAVRQVTRIDYEGMLPAQAGDFSGDPDSAAFRGTVFNVPDPGELTGVRVARDFFTGPSARGHKLTVPCSQAS